MAKQRRPLNQRKPGTAPSVAAHRRAASRARVARPPSSAGARPRRPAALDLLRSRRALRARARSAAAPRLSRRRQRLLESVLRQYPEEKELHERVRLYLNICQRQADAARGRAADGRRAPLRRDARHQRRPLRRGHRAPAPRARRRSRQRPRALHARRRPRAARRARRSDRPPRARDRAQPREPRRSRATIPISSRCATTRRSGRRSMRRRRSPPAPDPPPPVRDTNRAIIDRAAQRLS